jgi:hypothetical protein
MLIVYCDTCGVRIREEDLNAGLAIKSDEHSYCPKCAPSSATKNLPLKPPSVRMAAHPPATPATTSSSKLTPHRGSTTVTHARPATTRAPGPQNAKPSVAVILGVIGACCVLVAAFMAMKGGGSGQAASQRNSSVAAPVEKAVEAKLQEPAKTTQAATVQLSSVQVAPVQSTPDESAAPSKNEIQLRRQKADDELAQMRDGRAARLLTQAKSLRDGQASFSQMKEMLDAIEAALAAPEIAAAQAGWESGWRDGKQNWVALSPEQYSTTGGAQVDKLPDQSLRLSGNNPEKDTLTLKARSTLSQITAIRLEAMSDPGFNGGGPGRSDNGNIVLTTFAVSATPENGAEQPLPFKSASAEFSQKDFPIANTIDSNPESGWGVMPKLGMTHNAVFELQQPLALDAKTQLNVTIASTSPHHRHVIGRLRVSVTSSATPTQLLHFGPDIAAAIEKPADARTADERKRITASFLLQANVNSSAQQKLNQLRTAMGPLQEYERALTHVIQTNRESPAAAEAKKLIEELKPFIESPICGMLRGL